MSHGFTIICHSSERDVWLTARRRYVGASDVPVILGLRSGLARLWAEKTGREVEALSGEQLDWGHLMEPVILGEMGRRANRPTRQDGHLYGSTAWPFMAATIDGWCATPEGDRLVEIKNVGEYHSDSWSNGAPELVTCQVQAQMIVTGERRATIAACIGGNKLVWQDVDADLEYQQRIIAACDHFWRTHVLGDTPPPDPYLGDVLPERKGLTVDLSPEIGEDYALYAALQDEESSLKARIAEVKGRIVAAIGEASEGLLPDGSGFSFKTVTKEPGWHAGSTYRVLKVLKPSKKRAR